MRRIRIGDLKALFTFRKLKGGWLADQSGEQISLLAAEYADYSPQELGEMFEVTAAEYKEAGPFRQIDPIDMSRAERRQHTRGRENERRIQKRRGKGMKTRAEYEAQSLSAIKPWETMGISRRTWERKRASGQITNNGVASLATINLSENDTLASARVEVEPTNLRDVKEEKVSLSVRTATDPRLVAKLEYLEALGETKKVPAPPCKPGGIRERAWLSVMARYEAARAEAA
jgi:hypothetical protein